MTKILIPLIAAGVTYLLGVILLTAYCWLIHWRERAHIVQKNRLLEHLMQLLGTGELDQKQIRFRRKDLREALVTVCKLVSGPMIDRARGLYIELGFMQEDLLILKRGRRKYRKIQALMRIRLLRADLPPAVWERLVKHRSTPIRWLAMEAFITVRGRSALSVLFGYAQDPANERLGVLIHLFSLYASSNSSGLLTILDDDATGEVAQLALLTTLRYYPHPGSEVSILALLRKTYTVELQRCALEALKPYSSGAVLEVLEKFSHSPDPSIKQAVAFALHESNSEIGLQILENLSLDMSHAVRRQAIDSLCSVMPPPEAILDRIRAEPEHPAYELLSIRESQEKAA